MKKQIIVLLIMSIVTARNLYTRTALAEKIPAQPIYTGQSPIVLPHMKPVKGTLDVNFVEHSKWVVKAFENGYPRLDISAADGKKDTLTIDGVEYTCIGMHFHKRSEHRFERYLKKRDRKNIRKYFAEFHIVFKSKAGGLAVIGIPVAVAGRKAKNEDGQPYFNEFFSMMFAGTLHDQDDMIKPGSVTLLRNNSFQSLLPKKIQFYRYNGSLTTKPYTEGVIWNVITKPIKISRLQAELMKKNFHPSSRDPQPLGQRSVVLYTA